MPTLMNSPRSTCGTTRMTAYSNELRPRMQRLLDEKLRRIPARGQIAQIGGALLLCISNGRIIGQPVGGKLGDDAGQRLTGQARPQWRIYLGQSRSPWQQHMISYSGKRPLPLKSCPLPGVVKIQRRAMIDQPEPAVPRQDVGIAHGAVRVRDIGVEPDDLGC